MIQEGKRVEWVDIGKAICIFFILVTHLEARTDILYSFYSPIYLSGFFFLSGYTYKEKDSFKEMFLGKVRILLWPWLLYSLLNIFASAVITLHSDFSLLSSLKNLFLQIRGEGDGLWFLAALFVAYIPFYFVIKLLRPGFAIVISCMLSVVSVVYCELFPSELLPWGTTSLPWHIEYMFQAMLWMVLGYYFKNACTGFFEDMLDKHKNIFTCIISLVVYTIIAYIPCGGGYCFKHNCIVY